MTTSKKDSRRRNEAAQLRALTTLPLNRQGHHVLQPIEGEVEPTCTLGDAATVLDLIQLDWYESTRQIKFLSGATEADPDWCAYQRLTRMRRTLVWHAAKIKRLELSSRAVKNASSTWLSDGVLTKSKKGETTFLCVFCSHDLATFANRGGRIPDPVMKRIDTHTHQCAMRFCLEIYEQQQGLAK